MFARLSLAFLAGGLFGCAADPTTAAAGRGEVESYGALRAIFHQGQIGPIVRLDRLLPDAELYAVGALSDLAGEVTIAGGTAYLSYPDGDHARTVTGADSGAAATLLVAARVPRWQACVVEEAIPFAELDRRIGELAAAAGLDPEGRVPFLLEGAFEDLRWHVVDGSRLSGGGSSHEDHLAAGVSAARARSAATLVGFYSRHDQGVFTHAGSMTHLHCVLAEPLAAGHVDHIMVPAGTVLKFPVARP